MEKENAIKAVFAAALTALTAYLGKLAVPFVVLVSVMVLDYVSGMVKAWMLGQLSSKIGFKGVLKKLSYFAVIAVGMVCDYVISQGIASAGVQIGDLGVISLLIIFWLMINEMISILENLSLIGVPLPNFLIALVNKLKVATEKKAEDEEDSDE